MFAVTEGGGALAGALGWVKRHAVENVPREAVLPFACLTVAMVCSASSEGGACLLGVAGLLGQASPLFLEPQKGEEGILPFWRCLLAPPRPVPALEEICQPGTLCLCLPCVGSQGTTYVSWSSWVSISWEEETDPEAWEDVRLAGFKQAPVTLLWTHESGVFPIPGRQPPNAVLVYLFVFHEVRLGNSE